MWTLCLRLPASWLPVCLPSCLAVWLSGCLGLSPRRTPRSLTAVCATQILENGGKLAEQQRNLLIRFPLIGMVIIGSCFGYVGYQVRPLDSIPVISPYRRTVSLEPGRYGRDR